MLYTTLLYTAHPWNFEQVKEVFLTEKINCMHLVREKTHKSSRTFELKTKSMAGEGGAIQTN